MCKGLLGEEDGTTGTQEVPRSMPRSYWQLRFENIIAMVAPTTLHIPTDNLEVYSPHLYGDLQTNRIIASRLWSVCSVHVQNIRLRGWFFGSLDKPVQVGWRLKMLLWEFAEAVGEGSSMEGQGMIASIEDTGPFKETQSPSLMQVHGMTKWLQKATPEAKERDRAMFHLMADKSIRGALLSTCDTASAVDWMAEYESKETLTAKPAMRPSWSEA
ncbi:hypothetical protein BU17DRAFT_101842 [Hysterangium stoloniferum]|nr:hypothetical protein BU17DRAFT_101842 [Hysterangium stoloniferum]